MSKRKKTPEEQIVEIMLSVSLVDAESLLNTAKVIVNQRKKDAHAQKIVPPAPADDKFNKAKTS